MYVCVCVYMINQLVIYHSVLVETVHVCGYMALRALLFYCISLCTGL